MAAPRNRFATRHVVGWFDRSEWRYVRECLFSNDNDVTQLKQGIRRIAVWKSRVQKQLPLNIECTYNIIQAVIEDKLAVENSTVNEKDLTLRMNYSTALVRYVSLLTEKLQKKMEAQPMHKLAKTLGVPFWMVELRHEASHGSLPSLYLLRQGVETALSLLKKEYWDIERMSVDHVGATKTVEVGQQHVEGTLVKYMTSRYKAMQSGEVRVSADENSRNQNNLMRLHRILMKDRKMFFSCLLRNGYLIPEEEQFRALNVDIKDYLAGEKLSLPLDLVEIWWEFIVQLDTSLNDLISKALSEAPRADPLRRKLMYSWAALLLESVDTSNSQTGELKRGVLYFCARPPVDYKALLDIVTESPNEMNRQLLPRILLGLRPRLRASQRKRILEMTDALLEKTRVTKKKNGKMKTKRLVNVEGLGALRRRMEDALRDIQARTTTKSDAMANKNESNGTDSQWKLSTENVDWSEIPFGQCPGQLITYRNMELRQHDAESDTLPTPISDRIRLQDAESDAIPTPISDRMDIEEASEMADVEDIISSRDCGHNEERTFDWPQKKIDAIVRRIEPLVLGGRVHSV